MSWIKNNKFLAALGGATLVVLVLLCMAGLKGASHYDQAKEEFESAAREAGEIERLPLYPSRPNLDGKSKALDEYRKAVESLQTAYGNFRPEALQNVSPETFTDHLVASTDEARKAFSDAGTEVPDAFFCGFEDYKTSLARGDATGILDYQLASIKKLMLDLAASGATQLKNLHRPPLAEEAGREFKPWPDQVARQLPLEITFKGPEKSVRAFLSTIVKPDGRYVVIRSLRVSNEKQAPPRASDAKFDEPLPATSGPAVDDLFGAFVLPGEEPANVGGPVEAPAPAAAADTAKRILSQVLGNEELHVFLRLDLMQFLPAKPLP